MEKEEGGAPEARPKPERTFQRKQSSFQERLNIKKERKKKVREQKIEKYSEKVDRIEQEHKKREKETKTIRNAKTRTGQPLMGPRIKNLLGKIQLAVQAER